MTSSEPSSPSQPFPNLGNVITADDVSQKGTGSYKADYVNWCRTMHLLHEHAPGWQFALATAPGGGHVWKAPNETGYVVGYFIGPDRQTSPHFPQAIMDNRNNAIAFTKVSARDLTDSHRRCLCTAAAAQFGLAWQLWAREEVENPHREEKKAKKVWATIPTALVILSSMVKKQNTRSDEDEVEESCPLITIEEATPKMLIT